MPISNQDQEAIREQIATLTARAKQLRAKMEAGEELTPEEDHRLDVITSQIRHLMEYLK